MSYCSVAWAWSSSSTSISGDGDREIALEIKESLSGKAFNEDISKLIDGGDKFYNKILVKNKLSNKVEIHLNMLGVSMENKIGGNCKTRDFVTL